MRFRFCGDDQCPQWVLSEMEPLSSLKADNIKLIVREILKICWEESLDYEKILGLMEDEAEETSDLKGAMAALYFILTSAAKHNVDELSLVQEVQQLGLPQENANIIGSEYDDSKAALQCRLAADSYRLSQVVDTNWRVDVLSESEDKAKHSNIAIQLRLLIDNQPQISMLNGMDSSVSSLTAGGNQRGIEDLTFGLSVEKLDLLILELTQAKSILDKI